MHWKQSFLLLWTYVINTITIQTSESIVYAHYLFKDDYSTASDSSNSSSSLLLSIYFIIVRIDKRKNNNNATRDKRIRACARDFIKCNLFLGELLAE